MATCLPLTIILLKVVGMTIGAKILLIPPQLGSHIVEQVIIGEELAARGNDVYIAMGSPSKWLDSIERRGVKPLVFRFPDSALYGASETFERLLTGIVMTDAKDKLVATYKSVASHCYLDCAHMMADERFLGAVKEIGFDLAFVEAFLPAPCYFIVPKFLGIPFVSSALWYRPWPLRIPALPSFLPLEFVSFASLSSSSSADSTVFTRMLSLIDYLMIDATFDAMAPENTSLLQRFSPELTTWQDLLLQSRLFFVLTDHHLSSVVPQMPNYVSIAGVTASRAKALPPDLETVMAEATGGVIVLSFGSSASFFPPEVIAKFFAAFERCSETTFVARLNVPDGLPVPRNVKALPWLPQNDLLGHRNTRLFITHCGNGGLHEAVYHAVPLIGFPLFAEQHFNCRRMVRRGLGLEMVIQEFTPEQLIRNIREVLGTSRYRETVGNLSERFRHQPQHPLDRVVFWIDHVIQYGGDHLRPLAMDMPLHQFLMLDVLALLLAVAFIAVCALLLALRCIWRHRLLPFGQSSRNKRHAKSN